MNNSDQSAFPLAIEGGLTNQNHIAGLTKREYFAAMAMQGLLMNYNQNGMYGNNISCPKVEIFAVQCADQLLKELQKPINHE